MGRYKCSKLTRDKLIVDKALRSPFFDHLEESGRTYEIKEYKLTVMIKRHYQCGVAAYQLAKLWKLELYYDLFDKYLNRQDYKLWYMDTGLFYLAMSDDLLDEIVKPRLRQTDEVTKKR